MPKGLARWEWASLPGVLAAFIAIRLPLCSDPGLILGWNSDGALFGMMARAMREGWDFPLYFWGQFYLGTLTSMITATIGAILGDVDPLALRMGGGRSRNRDRLLLARAAEDFGRSAMLALLWLAAGPAFLFHFTIAPIGAEAAARGLGAVLVRDARRSTASATRHPRRARGTGHVAARGRRVSLHGDCACAVRRARGALRFVIAFAVAFAAGYLPAIVARLRGDPLLYTRTLLSWSFSEVFSNFAEFFSSDLWLLLGGLAAGIAVIVSRIVGLRGRSWKRTQMIIVTTCAECGVLVVQHVRLSRRRAIHRPRGAARIRGGGGGDREVPPGDCGDRGDPDHARAFRPAHPAGERRRGGPFRALHELAGRSTRVRRWRR